MRFFFPESPVETGLFINFLLLFIFRGGREPVGLALYIAISIATFVQVLKKPISKTPLDRYIFPFVLILMVSTLLSLPYGTRGIVHFSVVFAHFLNFYTIWQIRNSNFGRRLSLWILAGSFWMSSKIYFEKIFNCIIPLVLPNSNLEADFIGCGILICLSRIFFSSPSFSRRERTQLSGILIFLSGGHLLIFSRGSLVSLAAAGMVLLCSNWKMTLRYFSYYLIAVLLVLNLTVSPMRWLASKIGSTGATTRTTVWRGAWSAFKEKPVLGWGLGSFARAYRTHRLPIEQDFGQYEKTTRFAHNEFFQLAVETGSAGFLIWLIFVCAALAFGLKSYRSSAQEWHIRAALFCWISLLVHSLIDFNLHLPMLAFLFITFAALMLKNSIAFSEKVDFEVPPNTGILIRRILYAATAIPIYILISFGIAQHAKNQLSQERIPQAERLFRIASYLNPFSESLLAELMGLPVSDENMARVEATLPFHKGDDAPYAYLARAYFHRRNLEQSIRNYQIAILNNPKDPFYYAELADIYIKLNEIPPALALYKNAINIEPLYILPYYQIGQIYLLEGKRDLALAAFLNIKKIRNSGLIPWSDYTRRMRYLPPKVVEQRIRELANGK